MRVTLFVFGSWGDLRPYVALGRGLKAAGIEVQIVAAKEYETWVRAHDLAYYPLSVGMSRTHGRA